MREIEMEPYEICRFCNITSGVHQYSGIDEPFLSNDKFFAIASIGPLIEGWTLIIPKSHHLSMKYFYNNPLLDDFCRCLLPVLNQRYGQLIAFEHGANSDDSITACGTAHAHLHIVPFETSLVPELQDSDMKWNKCRASEIASKTGEAEYLFYADLDFNGNWGDPLGYFHILETPISQFFRRIIAEKKGNIKASDYKIFPNFDLARQTRKALVSSFA